MGAGTFAIQNNRFSGIAQNSLPDALFKMGQSLGNSADRDMSRIDKQTQLARQEKADARAKALADRQQLMWKQQDAQKKAEDAYYNTLDNTATYAPGAVTDAVVNSKIASDRLNKLALTPAEQTAMNNAGVDSDGETNWSNLPTNMQDIVKHKVQAQAKYGQDLVNNSQFKTSPLERVTAARKALIDAGGHMTSGISNQILSAQNAVQAHDQLATDAINKNIAALTKQAAALDEKKMKAGYKTTGKRDGKTYNSDYGDTGYTNLYKKVDTYGNNKVIHNFISNLEKHGYSAKQAGLILSKVTDGQTKTALYDLTDFGKPDIKSKKLEEVAKQYLPKNLQDPSGTEKTEDQMVAYYDKKYNAIQKQLKDEKAKLTKYTLSPEDRIAAIRQQAAEDALPNILTNVVPTKTEKKKDSKIRKVSTSIVEPEVVSPVTSKEVIEQAKKHSTDPNKILAELNKKYSELSTNGTGKKQTTKNLMEQAKYLKAINDYSKKASLNKIVGTAGVTDEVITEYNNLLKNPTYRAALNRNGIDNVQSYFAWKTQLGNTALPGLNLYTGPVLTNPK